MTGKKKYDNFFLIALILFGIMGNTFSVLAQDKGNIPNPNGYNTFYYDNGIKSSEGPMVNGKPDGYWKNYYKDGTLKNEGNRKNHLLDSLWSFYSEKGKIQKQYYYKEGKKHGFVLYYDTLERLTLKEQFKNDSKEGDCYWYYPNGKIQKILPYKNGKPDGKGYEFAPDSIITGILIYSKGFLESSEHFNKRDKQGLKQGLWKEFYPDGKVKRELRYRDDVVDGFIKEFDPKGDLKTMEKYEGGKKETKVVNTANVNILQASFPNGNIRYEGAYVNGVPEGTHIKFREGGKVCDSVFVMEDTIQVKKERCTYLSIPDSAFVFEEGFLIERGPIDSLRHKRGIWEGLHPNGKMAYKGSYEGELKIGDWVYYFPTGKIEQQGKYSKKGFPTGNWKWYYENGNLKREENFHSAKLEGEFKEFTSENNLISKGLYVDGQKEGIWEYALKNHKEIGKYVADLPDSTWKAYYIQENKVKYVGNFMNGEPEGKHTWYYPNGKIQATGNFQGGMKQGDWFFYDEEGIIYLTIRYENDEEVKWNGILVDFNPEESLKVYDDVKKKVKE